MKSEISCPACGSMMDTHRHGSGQRLWCASTHCLDYVCSNGEHYEPRMGEDVHAAAERLRERFARSKEGAKP